MKLHPAIRSELRALTVLVSLILLVLTFCALIYRAEALDRAECAASGGVYTCRPMPWRVRGGRFACGCYEKDSAP